MKNNYITLQAITLVCTCVAFGVVSGLLLPTPINFILDIVVCWTLGWNWSKLWK